MWEIDRKSLDKNEVENPTKFVEVENPTNFVEVDYLKFF